MAKELERLATAAGKWNELLVDYTQVVQGIADPQQAADLWVKIARWYDSAVSRTDYGIASAQPGAAAGPDAHGRAGGAGGLLPQAVAVARAGAGAGPPRRGRAPEPARKVEILLALADTYETQLGDAAQAMLAYQQALDVDERCMDAIDALERLYRRTQAWDRLVDVLNKKSHTVDDGELAIKLRLQVGELWEERLGDNDRAVEAYKEVLTVDPQNLAGAEGARAAVREDRARWRSTSTSSSTSWRSPAPDEERVAPVQRDGRRSGRRSSTSPTGPSRRWRRSC